MTTFVDVVVGDFPPAAAAQRPTDKMMRCQQRSSRKRERDPDDDDERLFSLGMTRRSQLGMSCDCDLVKRLEADIDAARKKPFFFFLSFASGSKILSLVFYFPVFCSRGTPNRIRTLRVCVVSCLRRPDSH